VIETVARNAPPPLTGPDAVVHEFTRELVDTGRVGDALHARAVATLGEVGVADLVGVVGYYTLVAFTLNAGDVPAPPGAPTLP
jgi:4-carboxymuconolactone decarboxylase